MVKVTDTNKTNHKVVIKSWFDAVSTDGGIERFDDLHIDRIDDSWKLSNTWISAALESFRLALQVRDESGQVKSLVILLAIDLRGDENPLGFKFEDLAGLEKSLSYTPPSLYILRRGQEFWRGSQDSLEDKGHANQGLSRQTASMLFGPLEVDWECFATESKKADDDEYFRSIYLAG